MVASAMFGLSVIGAMALWSGSLSGNACDCDVALSPHIENTDMAVNTDNEPLEEALGEPFTSNEIDTLVLSVEEPIPVELALDAIEAMVARTFENPTYISWYKRLINQYNTLERDYSPSLRTLAGSSQQVRTEIYEPLNQMMESARATGATIWVQSSYRPYSTQSQLFDGRVSRYMGQGYSREQAERNTALWIAAPGTSEHQSGLAVDFNEITMAFEHTNTFQWLTENAHRYGFILRYPREATHITGVNFEPWHWRYVGVDHATTIWEYGVTLEEYVTWYFGR